MVFSHSQNLVISPSNQSLITSATNYLQIIRIRFVGSTATMIKFALCASSVSQHIFFPVSSPKQDPQNKVLYLHIIYHAIEKISSDRFPGSQHCNPLQGSTGKYREIQGNPCNENRDPAMRTGFPCNLKAGFSLWELTYREFPVSLTGFGFTVNVSHD